MLGWALTFLIVALVAAILGFGGIAGAAVGIAKIIFFVAIVLLVFLLKYYARTSFDNRYWNDVTFSGKHLSHTKFFP